MTEDVGRLDRPQERLPLFGDELPEAHISLHAVLLHGGQGWFDDEGAHGFSFTDAGIQWTSSVEELEEPECWTVVWVAVTHSPDGTRAYTGLAADRFWFDRRSRKGVRYRNQDAVLMNSAVSGRILLDELPAADRETLRHTLLMRDPDAWDRASDAVRRALHPDRPRARDPGSRHEA